MAKRKPVTKKLMYQWLRGACLMCLDQSKPHPACRNHSGWKRCGETLAAIRRLIRSRKGE